MQGWLQVPGGPGPARTERRGQSHRVCQSEPLREADAGQKAQTRLPPGDEQPSHSRDRGFEAEREVFRLILQNRRPPRNSPSSLPMLTLPMSTSQPCICSQDRGIYWRQTLTLKREVNSVLTPGVSMGRTFWGAVWGTLETRWLSQ